MVERPEWLCVRRVLDGLELTNSCEGLAQYGDYMDLRMLEMRHSSEPWKIDARWKEIRRGWCFGDTSFRKEMLERLDDRLESRRRESFSGEDMVRHDEVEAERLLDLCVGIPRCGLAG